MEKSKFSSINSTLSNSFHSFGIKSSSTESSFTAISAEPVFSSVAFLESDRDSRDLLSSFMCVTD